MSDPHNPSQPEQASHGFESGYQPQGTGKQLSPNTHPIAVYRNASATAALVLGIIATAFSVSGAGLTFGWMPGVLAIFLGFRGLRRAKQFRGFKRNQALAGVILGFASGAVTLLVVLLAVLFHAVQNS